ncbi:hypothetical protein [uncultured Clostridium sp.]|jgi:hypothetical protein|uniref:hypothetical protein n=1 Tax=uncultured Clostridium sp. TaxID=59620 RepID=UPI00261F76E2|nr:hypothetical protein [uncultured Clostridium sp.]
MDFSNKSKYEKYKPIIAVVLAILVFTMFYLGSYYYNLNKVESASKEVEVIKEEAAGLKDDILVMFTRENEKGEDEVYRKITILELKKALKVEIIEEEELIKILTSRGYEKSKKGENSLSFSKAIGSGLTPNKYYIGDKDGYIAIYKTDENGKAFIEKEADISFVKTDNFPEPDVERIKGFARVFDTRAECEEVLDSYKG